MKAPEMIFISFECAFDIHGLLGVWFVSFALAASLLVPLGTGRSCIVLCASGPLWTVALRLRFTRGMCRLRFRFLWGLMGYA